MTINTLPAFLTQLAIALSPGSSAEFATEHSNTALLHGNERAKMTGYSLAQLINEYQILRKILCETLFAEASPTPAEWMTVHQSLDRAIAEAASAFVEVHRMMTAQLTASLTHDFRGPLSVAINYLELIRRSADQTRREFFIERASESLYRIDRMIRGVLDTSRAQSGERMALRPSQCELRQLVREVLEECVAKDGDRFVFDCAGDIPMYCDSDRVREALYNLIENAVKYGFADTPVTVYGVLENRRVMLSVHNHGEPIDEGEQPELFKAYRRSASASRGETGGWGLGLSVVQAIAEAHGGSVSVESAAELGTTFTLDILQDVRDLEAPDQGTQGRAS